MIVSLGWTFGTFFFTFSVLHCHGVSLSGSRVFVAWLAASWSKKVEKVGKIVVLVGFQKGRLAVFGRFFSLLRPSLPWCFPIREVSFEQPQQQQEEKVAKIIIFDLFRKLHEAVFGHNFDASPSFPAMVLSHPGGIF